MSYKIIVVHLDHAPPLAATAALAADIAIAQGAHVIGVVAAAMHEQAHAQAPEAFLVFGGAMRRAGVASFETRLLEGDPASSLGLMGRYCDLMILGRRDADDTGAAVHADFCEFIAMNCACPVLLAPVSHHAHSLPRRPLLAWNGSAAAAKAVRAALPLLHAARQATVAVINAPTRIPAHESEPGAAIALYLRHHGINADIVRQTVDADAGHALLTLAAGLQCDLIVLGSNTHPHFDDVLHQGTMRTVLQNGTVASLLYR